MYWSTFALMFASVRIATTYHAYRDTGASCMGTNLVSSWRSRWCPGDANLHHAVGEHGVGNLDEAPTVCALHVVDRAVVRAAVLHARLMNAEHDLLEPFVDLAPAPGDTHGV